MTTTQAERRRIVANMVAGLDGAAAVGGRVGALSGPADQDLFRSLRADADVVLVGAGTVRAERYGPVRLTDAQVAARIAAGRAPRPPVAVISRSLALDWTIPMFTSTGGPRPIILTCTVATTEARAEAARHADVIVAGDASVDLAQALDALDERGLSHVLTEGGPALLGELIDLELLDELRLTLAPYMGGDQLPIATGVASGDQVLTRFDLADVREVDGHLFLRYLTRSPRHAE